LDNVLDVCSCHSIRFDGVYGDKQGISLLYSILLSGREVARPQNETVGEETRHDRGSDWAN